MVAARKPRSTAEGRHRTARLQERHVLDAVAGPLREHRRLPPFGDLRVAGAGPQRATEVALLAGEQAVADLSVGGEPDPVAVAAERPGDRGDHADHGGTAVDEERLRRRT